jgi:hypothetical protein
MDDNTKEIWKSIEGYERYQISNFGRVRSLRFKGKNNCIRIIKPFKTRKGYLRIKLNGDKKRNAFLVHRLVGMAFILNPKNKPQINHIDEIKDNNNVNNLEWVTNNENINHGTAIKRKSLALTNGKKSKKVKQLTLDKKLIKVWISVSEAARNGFNSGNICACCKGKRKNADGFKWEYV